MDIKKEVYLGIAAIALYAAAREYGIHSLADAKRKFAPYLKWIDVIDALTKDDQSKRSTAANGSGSGGARRLQSDHRSHAQSSAGKRQHQGHSET